MLALRLNIFIANCLHPDQVNFVSKRQALDHTRWLIHLISALQSNLDRAGIWECMFLLFDLHKAFDLLNWENVFLSLNKRGCCPHFL